MASVNIYRGGGSPAASTSVGYSEGYRAPRGNVGRSVDSLPARASYKLGSYTDDAVKTTLDDMDDALVKQAFKGKGQVSNSALDGIWVSREFWRTIRRQLEEKIVECSDLKEQLQRANRLHEVEMRSSYKQRVETEDQVRGVERDLQAQVVDAQRATQTVQAELYSKEEMYRQQIRELSAQVEDLSRRLKSKESLVHDIEDQRKQIGDTQMAIRMEQHRSAMADSKVKSLQNDLEHQREREMSAQSRCQVLEKRVLDLSKECQDVKETAMMYREQLQESVQPNRSLGREIHRLQVDNKRLLALLEHTEDFRRYVQDKALSKGLHYIPLAECFAMEQTVGAVYPPNRDRHIALPTEEYNWVPREIVNGTVDFLVAHFPDMPMQPFMQHLIEINKAWRQREEKKLREIRREHKAEMIALKTAHRRAQPYSDVMYKQKLEWTKKQLGKKEKKVKKLATYRRALDEKHNASPGDAWSVHAIEALTDRMGALAQESEQVRRQVTGTLAHFQSAATSPGARSPMHEPASEMPSPRGAGSTLASPRGAGSPPLRSSPSHSSSRPAAPQAWVPSPTSAPVLALPTGTVAQSSRASISSAPVRSSLAVPARYAASEGGPSRGYLGVSQGGGNTPSSPGPIPPHPPQMRSPSQSASDAGVLHMGAGFGRGYTASESLPSGGGRFTTESGHRGGALLAESSQGTMGGVPLPSSVLKFERRDTSTSAAV